jgi:hypothetical protein
VKRGVHNRGFIFPHDVLGRIVLFVASAFWAPVFGFIAYAIFIGPAPVTLEGRVFSSVVSELSLAGCLLFATGLAWSLFCPNWLESLVKRLTLKFILCLAVFILLSCPYAIWACFHA